MNAPRPITQLVPDAAAQLPILRLRCELRSAGLKLPRHKSSVFHGAFGRALSQVAPRAFARLWAEADAGQVLVPPYALVPPLDERETLLPGALLTLELHLFGDATALAASCLAALQHMGQQGVGRDRGQVAVSRVEHITPQGAQCVFDETQGFLGLPHAAPASAIMDHWAGRQAQVLTVFLDTPLRLKNDNRLVGGPPSFELLFARLLGRVALLSGHVLPSGFKREWLENAAAIEIDSSDVRWVDWPRYSARQQVEMRFGGQQGHIRYRGALAPFLPWLGLAEYLLVGGKTTFGLGKIRLLTD
jgi:hypothetical protein